MLLFYKYRKITYKYRIKRRNKNGRIWIPKRRKEEKIYKRIVLRGNEEDVNVLVQALDLFSFASKEYFI